MPSDEKQHLLDSPHINVTSYGIVLTNADGVGKEPGDLKGKDEIIALGESNVHTLGQEPEEEKGKICIKQRTMSDREAFLNLVKGNLGTGLIGLPFAFHYAGFAVGFVSMLFVCAVAINCMQMLARSSHRLCESNDLTRLSYAGVAEKAFELLPCERLRSRPKLGRIIVQVFLCITQLGFCAVYFVFIPANMQQVLAACNLHLSVRLLILIFLPILIVGVMIKDLKTLAVFSALGNILQTISILIMFFYLGQHLKFSQARLTPKGPLDMALFFGLAMFSVEGIGVVLPLENDMKKPAHFFRVINSGMAFVSVLYLAMGSLGYLSFGDKTLGSITLNLPKDPIPENLPYIFVKLFYSVAIMSSYLVQFYVAIEILEVKLLRHKIPEDYHRVFSCSFRAGLVTLTAALAAGVPQLGLFISLVGAFGSSALAMIFPPLINNIVFWDELNILVKGKNFFLAFVGFIGMIVGTYSTVVEMAAKL